LLRKVLDQIRTGTSRLLWSKYGRDPEVRRCDSPGVFWSNIALNIVFAAIVPPLAALIGLAGLVAVYHKISPPDKPSPSTAHQSAVEPAAKTPEGPENPESSK
jgi:hypothetical protein